MEDYLHRQHQNDQSFSFFFLSLSDTNFSFRKIRTHTVKQLTHISRPLWIHHCLNHLLHRVMLRNGTLKTIKIFSIRTILWFVLFVATMLASLDCCWLLLIVFSADSKFSNDVRRTLSWTALSRNRTVINSLNQLTTSYFDFFEQYLNYSEIRCFNAWERKI